MRIFDIINFATIPLSVISAYLLLNAFSDERIYSKKIEIISYILYYVVLVIGFFLTKREPINDLVTDIVASSIMVVGFFLISLNYSTKLFHRITMTIIVYSIMVAMDKILWYSTALFEKNILGLENIWINSSITLILTDIVIIIVSYYIYKFAKQDKKYFRIPTYYYLINILILVGTLYLYFVILESDTSSITQILITGIVVMSVNGSIIFLDEKIYRAMLLYSERNMLKQQNLSYENQTEIINQSLTAIKSLKHDMKNHILVLSSMNNENEEIKEYTKKILEQIDNNNQLVQSNNFIIDSIVNFKLQELNNFNVDIKIDVKVSPQLNILAYDLTTILGNLLDNAITALKEISPTKNKKLVFSMYCNKGSLIILIDNSFDGKISIQNGKYKTTKAFKSNHGIGLQSVEKTIATYGGNMQIEHTDNNFSVAVLIPYTE